GLSMSSPNPPRIPFASREPRRIAPCWKSWNRTNDRTITIPSRPLAAIRAHHGPEPMAIENRTSAAPSVDPTAHQLRQRLSCAKGRVASNSSRGDRMKAASGMVPLLACAVTPATLPVREDHSWSFAAHASTPPKVHLDRYLHGQNALFGENR